MAAIKISGFGGMLPALDSRLLPNHQAAQAENLWCYSGALLGLPTLKVLRELDSAATAKAYRIPATYTRPGDFDDSLWIEFENPFTDVIRAPVVNDAYDRYYWASSSDEPLYNTRLRLEYTNNPVSEVVTFTNADELVHWTGHPLEIGDKVQFTNDGGALPGGIAADTDYYVASTTFGADTFRLSTSLNGAVNGTGLVSLADDGTGTTTLTTQEHQPWILGIPQPEPVSINVVGGSAAVVARSYVITYVSAYGEEGPASDPVSATDNPDGSWDLTLPTPSSDDLGVERYLTLVRIYRTVTSASGVATYFFVAEQNINDTTYSDLLSDEEVSANDQLESTAWTGPPEDLEGWVLMPNGMIVGWRTDLNEVWFSEPYRPHAWPAEYVLAVEYPIVGMGVVNQTLVVATRGFPMTGSGVNPSSFSTSKLANFEPCSSRGSIASAPEGVYYASPNGLVRVVPGKATNITSNLVTKDRWQALTFVSALKVARLGTAIYAFGSARTEIFDDEAFEPTAFEQEDVTGAQAGVLLDVLNERVALSVLTSEDNTLNVFNDTWTGEVFIIRNGNLYWIDQIDPIAPLDPYLWRSKIFQLDFKKNLAAMKVYFEVPEQTPDLQEVSGVFLPTDDSFNFVGGYTGGGGRADAFDGVTDSANADCATSFGTADFLGLAWNNPVRIHSVRTWGSNENGYVNIQTPRVDITLYGSNVAPITGLDGTVLGSTSFIDTNDQSNDPRIIYSDDTDSEWDYTWVYVSHDGTDGTCPLAEVEFYRPQDVDLDMVLTDGMYGLVRVYADGVHVATRELRTSGDMIRLPSGFKADFWQFEIEARVRVLSLHAASTAKELTRV